LNARDSLSASVPEVKRADAPCLKLAPRQRKHEKTFPPDSFVARPSENGSRAAIGFVIYSARGPGASLTANNDSP
jgi:hypothetical protein